MELMLNYCINIRSWMSIFIAEIDAGWAMKKWFWYKIIAVNLEVGWAIKIFFVDVEVGGGMEICFSRSRSWMSDGNMIKIYFKILWTAIPVGIWVNAYSADTESEFHAEAHEQLRVKDLPRVPTRRLEVDSNQQPSGCKAPNIPLHHRVPQCARWEWHQLTSALPSIRDSRVKQTLQCIHF